LSVNLFLQVGIEIELSLKFTFQDDIIVYFTNILLSLLCYPF